MTYDPTNGTSLLELTRLVRIRMGDFPQRIHDADHTGDDSTTAYRLFDHVYEDDGVEASVGGVTTTSFTVDYDSGWLTFGTAPASDSEIILDYSVVTHTDEAIKNAINSALDDCYGPLVVQGQNDDLYADGTPELLCETSAGYDLGPEDIVERVEYWSDPFWMQLHDWRIDNHSGSKYLHFRRNPPTGTRIRISYIVRPGYLDLPAETLEGTAGLPSTAVEPIVLFACARLVSQQLTSRSHSNFFFNSEGASAPKAYDLRMRIQDLRAEGELALRKARPRRVVGSF